MVGDLLPAPDVIPKVYSSVTHSEITPWHQDRWPSINARTPHHTLYIVHHMASFWTKKTFRCQNFFSIHHHKIGAIYFGVPQSNVNWTRFYPKYPHLCMLYILQLTQNAAVQVSWRINNVHIVGENWYFGLYDVVLHSKHSWISIAGTIMNILCMIFCCVSN